jgi:hypothetical protein
MGSHRRTPKPRPEPGSPDETPPFYIVNVGGKAPIYRSNPEFRRPAMWALDTDPLILFKAVLRSRIFYVVLGEKFCAAPDPTIYIYARSTFLKHAAKVNTRVRAILFPDFFRFKLV